MADIIAIVAGLILSLFISITKNIFCFLTPGLPPHGKAGGSPMNVIVIVLGAVAYFTGRLY
jgi:hypothetical protein